MIPISAALLLLTKSAIDITPSFGFCADDLLFMSTLNVLMRSSKSWDITVFTSQLYLSTAFAANSSSFFSASSALSLPPTFYLIHLVVKEILAHLVQNQQCQSNQLFQNSLLVVQAILMHALHKAPSY